MDLGPPALLSWLKERFGNKRRPHAPNYAKAASDFERKIGEPVGAETLRHIANGYKRPGGLLAVHLEQWSKRRTTAAALLAWPHYDRQVESAA